MAGELYPKTIKILETKIKEISTITKILEKQFFVLFFGEIHAENSEIYKDSLQFGLNFRIMFLWSKTLNKIVFFS